MRFMQAITLAASRGPKMQATHSISRRAFVGSIAALAAVRYALGQQPGAATTAMGSKGFPLVIPGYFGSRPGVQLGTQLPASATEEDMQFARQLGVEWVMTLLRPEESTLENYQALIRRFANQGLKIY